MIKICCVSDNHGNSRVLDLVRMKYHDCDAYLHAGDSEMTKEALCGWACVIGNNDYYADLSESLVIEVKGFRILLLHSHLLGYANRNQRMVELAKKNHCQMVVFGHTHVFFKEVLGGVFLFNPGSLAYNRDYTPTCFGIVEINEVTHQIEKVSRINIKELEF